jgi:hypothetical protein
LERSKYFIPLLGFSTLFVAFNAAFFSVFGLSKLFAGATFSVILMASSLELAKLVTAAYLYRYWGMINKFMKSYLLVGVITLILITSGGIFGFLSNAYQGATIEFEKQSTTLLYKEDRLVQLEDDKVYLKSELEQAILELPENYRTAKRKLREEYNPKVMELNDQMLALKGEIGDLKTALIETGVDVGPAIYLARVFNTDIDTVVKFFIFILIFVFDPLAVSLVVAYNTAVYGSSRERDWEVYGEKDLTTKDKSNLMDNLYKKYKDKVSYGEDTPVEVSVQYDVTGETDKQISVKEEKKESTTPTSPRPLMKGGRRPT